MRQKDVKLFLDAKRDRLIIITGKKRRHKTQEEKAKYDDRYNKAIHYLGELNIIYSLLEPVGFMARTVSDQFVEIVRDCHGVEKLFEGEYLKLYRQLNTGEYLLVTSSVTNIDIFK